MTNPTSNFGWQMPTSTDLVTDLPADFETFGQAVDTSLAGLKGGTTGQVLSKTSNTDMAFTWVAQDDSNAIQNAIVDAKGDLIAASAADTPARLAVGNNGETLVADSSTSTGLAWKTASAQYPVQTWTPTWTNFTVGNGVLNYAYYVQIGKQIFFEMRFTLGSTSSMGTDPYFTLPAATISGVSSNFTGVLLDAGTASYSPTCEAYNSYCYFYAVNTSGAYANQASITATVPFTWAVNDRIYVSGSYLVA